MNLIIKFAVLSLSKKFKIQCTIYKYLLKRLEKKSVALTTYFHDGKFNSFGWYSQCFLNQSRWRCNSVYQKATTTLKGVVETNISPLGDAPKRSILFWCWPTMPKWELGNKCVALNNKCLNFNYFCVKNKMCIYHTWYFHYLKHLL